MGLEKLSLKSAEIMTKLYRLRKEDYRTTYDDWKEWWNLSGISNIGVMPYGSLFSYVLSTAPFDYWGATIEPELLYRENEYFEEYRKEEIDKMVKSISETIKWVEGEEPHTIAFTSIPTPCGNVFDLVGLAKISNNGTSYVFSNDLDYLKYLKSKGL